MTTILDQKYEGFESMVDIERDVSEAIAESGIPGEHQGTIRVVITYEPEAE